MHYQYKLPYNHISRNTYRKEGITKFRNSFINQWNLVTPRSTVLIEKRAGFLIVKKFPTIHGNRRFITAFTRARHLSPPRPRSIQSMPPYITSWRPILILSSHLRLGLPSGLFPSGFPTKILYKIILSSICATCPAHLVLFDLITRTTLGEEYRSLSSPFF